MQPDKELMSLDDPVDISSRLKDNNNVLATESRNNSGGLRWRSYEASDEEEQIGALNRLVRFDAVKRNLLQDEIIQTLSGKKTLEIVLSIDRERWCKKEKW
ncbi:hypothetical protein Bca52824_009086 [Brassica carinata]|uniref:Uncharacterized protein n=1 Tax=Brassica carinata TaxID=52824 RepID=A0A8X7W990_BRACI|nr:hypothetical protein Bca52824_009086 [Brassica carinata]